MANREDEYAKLRKFLNKAIRGPNTDAILRSVASGPVHLIDNIEAVNDSLYIVTAQGKFLDQRLGDKGVVRPSEVGLSDEVFRDIGIEITNRKQVRDLVHQLLRILYGDIFTRATSVSSEVETYNLEDGDNLLISFDGQESIELVFTASQFTNINAATAQEVADAITKIIRKVGSDGAAFTQEDGTDTKVVIVSPTDGPSSSVRILGGKAQNALKFDELRLTSGTASTQWTLTQKAGGRIRATWTGGSDPSLGKVKVGDYVNIYGTAFDFINRGTFNVVAVQGGVIGGICSGEDTPPQITEAACLLDNGVWTSTSPYVEFENPNGVAGIVTQGNDEAMLFFNPKIRTLISKDRYAAAFQTSPRTLEVFMPATTKIVRRDRAGAAHVYGQTQEETELTLPAGSAITTGQSFKISSYTDNFYIWFNVDSAGGNPNISGLKGIEISILSTDTNLEVCTKTSSTIDSLSYFSSIDNADGTINITSNVGGGSADAEDVDLGGVFNVNIITQGVAYASNAGQIGPYTYDTTVGFVIGEQSALTTEELDVSSDSILFVDNADEFPDSEGKLIIGLGTSHQEGPVPYISKPSDQTLRINPSYKFTKNHPIGTDVALIAQESPANPAKDGSDFPFYLTDSVAGRIYAENLIGEITATGIVVIIYILYPNDIGLGKWRDEENSEKYYIWGTEEDI